MAKQNARDRDEPSSEKVAAAEVAFRDMDISPSLVANWSYQKKVARAAEEAKIRNKKWELEDFIVKQSVSERDSPRLDSFTKQQAHNEQPEKAMHQALLNPTRARGTIEGNMLSAGREPGSQRRSLTPRI